MKLKRLHMTIVVLCLFFIQFNVYSFESKIGSSQRVFNNYMQKDPYGKPFVFETKSMEDQLRSIDANKKQNINRNDFRFQPPKDESFDYREIREGPGSSGSGNINALSLSQHLLILYAFVNNDSYFQDNPDIRHMFNVGFRKIVFVPSDEVKLNHGQIVDAKNYPTYFTIEVSQRMQELTRSITPTSVSFLSHEIFSTLNINDQGHVLSGHIFRKLSEQELSAKKLDGYFIQKSSNTGECLEKFKITSDLSLIRVIQVSSCQSKFSPFEIIYHCQDRICNVHSESKYLMKYDKISIGNNKNIFLLNTQNGQFIELEQEVSND